MFTHTCTIYYTTNCVKIKNEMKKVFTKRNIIIFIIVVGLIFIFWSSSLLQDYFQDATVFLQNYGAAHPYISILIFVGLSMLSAMLISFSSVWLVPAAVVLWNNHFTITLLLSSWLLGAVFSYLIGRYGGYPLVKKFVNASKVAYYEKMVTEKFGAGLIFLLRLTLPSEIPGYLLGIVRYSFVKYFIITFLAELPYAIYSVYAIDSIIEKKPTTFAVAAIIWFMAAWLLTYLYYKKIKKGADNRE